MWPFNRKQRHTEHDGPCIEVHHFEESDCRGPRIRKKTTLTFQCKECGHSWQRTYDHHLDPKLYLGR